MLTKLISVSDNVNMNMSRVKNQYVIFSKQIENIQKAPRKTCRQSGAQNEGVGRQFRD